MRLSREMSLKQDEYTPEQIAVGKNVSNYLKMIGIYGGENGKLN